MGPLGIAHKISRYILGSEESEFEPSDVDEEEEDGDSESSGDKSDNLTDDAISGNKIFNLIFNILTLSCLLLQKSNPYLQILDFSQLFVADAPMKKKNSKKNSFTPLPYPPLLFQVGKIAHALEG